MHPGCWRTIIAIACAGGVLLTSPAPAAPPSSIGHLTSLTGLPDAREQAQLERFVTYYGRRLGSDDPEAVGAARQSLGQPLRALQLSRFFRNAYSAALVPLLRPVIENGQTAQGKVNAVQLTAALGTDQALELLERHLPHDDEGDIGIRMWAARGINVAIRESREDQLIPEHKLAPAIRALGNAAQSETDWRVLQWQFDSLASIEHPVARGELERAFAAVLQRMAAMSEATPMVKAIGQYNDPRSRPRGPLSTLNNRFLNLAAAQQRDFGRRLAAQLLQVLEVADAHWDTAQADADLQPAYQRVVRISERQLAIVHVTLGGSPLTTSMEQAFEDADRDAYQQQLDRLRTLLNGPPYR